MIEKKEKDWFKIKRYPHIGLPLKEIDRKKWIEEYVTNPEKIAKHSFLPFIHKPALVRKFRKKYNPDNGFIEINNIDGKIKTRYEAEKKRDLYYASHIDSLIFSYYSFILSKKYEEKIKENLLNEVVNAYRSIPIYPERENSPNKCNIDFANDVFKYILKYNENDFAVIAYDISSFFDNLDHKLLREVWCDILNTDRLPLDHFNIFKNITRFSYVDIHDIFEEFKDRIFTRTINKFGKPLEIKRKKIKRVRYLRNQNAIAFCTKDEFLDVKGKLLKINKFVKLKDGTFKKRNFGIPQGSPISSVLANVYLLHFDIAINNFIRENGGVYRRYSDDMVVVCPLNVKDQISKLVYEEIRKFKLIIQESKTQVFVFKRDGHGLKCGQEFNEQINWNKNFIYLGFEFDGMNVFLKSSSLSGFYRKMKRSVLRSKHFANRNFKKNKGEIFKHRLYKKFSYKGAKRIRKYIWSAKDAKFIKSDSYNWGNFLSYAYKASNIMVSNKIKQQTKRHWNILNKLLKK